MLAYVSVLQEEHERAWAVAQRERELQKLAEEQERDREALRIANERYKREREMQKREAEEAKQRKKEAFQRWVGAIPEAEAASLLVLLMTAVLGVLSRHKSALWCIVACQLASKDVTCQRCDLLHHAV